MSKVKKFDSFNESYLDEFGKVKAEYKVKVKDLIEYLKTLNTDTVVFLDKDGWDYKETPMETIKSSYLFYKWKDGDNDYLTINN